MLVGEPLFFIKATSYCSCEEGNNFLRNTQEEKTGVILNRHGKGGDGIDSMAGYKRNSKKGDNGFSLEKVLLKSNFPSFCIFRWNFSTHS